MIQKHTLIIGGTRGLGREFVRFYRNQGHAVSVISRNSPTSKIDKKVFYAQADISDKSQFLKALKKTVDQIGSFDGLILAQRFRGEDGWNGEIDLTLSATRTAIEFAKDHFQPKGAKSIVVISSVAGRYFIDDQPVGYHMAKAGLEQMVRYYAVVLGPQGIRVNGITPCAFVKEESKDFYSNNREIQSFYRTIAPLKRMVTTEDISHVVGFLSNPACFLTGQSLLMDGGISLLWPEAAAKRIKNPFLKSKKK